MARPRELKLEQGTVSLQGFPKEIADKLQEHIESFGKEETPIVNFTTNLPQNNKLIITQGPLIQNIKSNDLPQKAIGVFHGQGNDVRIVTVAYNIETKEAKVEHEQKCLTKADGVRAFKMAADKNKFV